MDKLRKFFQTHNAEFPNVISTEDLKSLPNIRLQMIMKMFDKSGSIHDFKKNISVLRVYGSSQVKFDTFVESLYKSLNKDGSNITKTENKVKNNVDNKKKIKQLDTFLKNSEVTSDQIVLFPKNETIEELDDDYERETSNQLNKINGIEVCKDPSMDLLKVSLQNKQMLSFYKSKLNLLTPSETSTIKEDNISNDTSTSNRALPIMAYKEQIIQLINENQICIITSQTGSGKSTQVPQFLMTKSSKIVMTQPRRLAATSLATRISEECDVKLGDEVGYKIRFENKSNEQKTKLIVMTEGILVNELTSLLKTGMVVEYTHIIIDEAHERSMNMDVILGLLKLGIKKRLLRNTKVVIMSATLDSSEYKRFFYNLPVLEVKDGVNEGRVYKVTEIFTKRPCYDQYKECFRLIKRIHEQESINKAVLVFMPGLEDIEVVSALIASVPILEKEVDVIKLHSSKNHNNDRLFKNQKGKRKVILATNIAETSITLPSLSFMINSGLYKLKTEFENLHKLTTVPITKMMMKQRVGRLGRVCEGTIYHLFTEDDHELMLDKNISEIEITNLKQVMLIRHYIDKNLQFIKEPLKRHCIQAEKVLLNHGCLTKQGDTLIVTDMGKFIINTPLTYSHARLLYLAKKNGCLGQAIDLVSMLSQRNIFFKNVSMSKDDKTMMSKGKRYESLFVEASDHLSLVNVYKQFSLQRDKSKWCADHDLNFNAMVQIEKVHNQLMKSFNLIEKDKKGNMDGLMTAVCVNLSLQNVAKKVNHKEYQILSNGLKCGVYPQSCLFGKIGDMPEYLVFEEIFLVNDMSYLINVSEFNPALVVKQDVCRKDYKVVKKVGCKDGEKVSEVCKKLKQWIDLSDKKVEVSNLVTKRKVEVLEEPKEDTFMFKKKKVKRTLKLID